MGEMLRKTTAPKDPDRQENGPEKKCSSSLDSERFKKTEQKFWVGLAISLLPLVITLALEYAGEKNFFAFWIPERTVFLCLTLTVSAMLDGMIGKEKGVSGWILIQFIMIPTLMLYYVLLAANESVVTPFFELTDRFRGLFHFVLLLSTLALCTLSYYTNCLRKEELP